MKTIYSYDNYEGDKGIILADSYKEAVEIYKKEYPKRKIANNEDEYYDNGGYINAEDVGDGSSKLLNIFPW